MATFYRVFNYVAGANLTDPGGSLFIPPQVASRIDNSDLYRALYVASSPAAAIAEVLGRLPGRWSESKLRGSRLIPGSIRVPAVFDLPDEAVTICDLDDPRQLAGRDLRPSFVITRNYPIRSRPNQSWRQRRPASRHAIRRSFRSSSASSSEVFRVQNCKRYPPLRASLVALRRGAQRGRVSSTTRR